MINLISGGFVVLDGSQLFRMRNTHSWRTVPELFFLFWLERAEPEPNTALLFTPSSWMCFLEVEAPTHTGKPAKWMEPRLQGHPDPSL